MDVVTAVGTRFFISGSSADTLSEFRSIADWVEVGLIESIGEFGDESEDIPKQAIGSNRVDHLKGLRSPVGFNLVVAHDTLDVGQASLSAAEDSIVQFAFNIILPTETSNILYFNALVFRDKWDIGTNDHILRKNYLCALNSEIFADTFFTFGASFQGAGSLSARLNMKINVAATYVGAGTLTAPINLRQRVTASFQGAGNLAADITVVSVVSNNWTVSANFAGAGNLAANVTVITNFLLLRDGVSKLLLRDGVSRLRLGH